jgi:uncharacterized protein (DUF2252 family)
MDSAAQTPIERSAAGKAARAKVPRSSHASYEPAPDRPDPISLLEEQAKSRWPELVPIRHGRMLSSPFAFYRGAAYVMASDLAGTPTSGIDAQLCGDAHLANFGGFASPERELLFDVNDFDETLPGPWEWDVKRLAASLAVAGRERGLAKAQRRRTVVQGTSAYREAMREFAALGDLEVWYARLDVDDLFNRYRKQLGTQQVRRTKRNLAKARAKDRMRAMSKLTQQVDGSTRIRSQPPLIIRLEELMKGKDQKLADEAVRKVLASYDRSLQEDRRHLLSGYRIADIAHKVVGVGSVGTRAWIVLLIGRDEGDPLFLQCKEAQRSVVEPFVKRKSRFKHQGRRVVEGQRLMQAASDMLLGWYEGPGIDGVPRHFYVRQLWDWKASADVETMTPRALGIYAEMCGWTLARAHARSGDRIAIASYLGKGDTFDEAIADFAEAYADQNEADYEAMAKAAKSGRIPVEDG